MIKGVLLAVDHRVHRRRVAKQGDIGRLELIDL